MVLVPEDLDHSVGVDTTANLADDIDDNWYGSASKRYATSPGLAVGTGEGVREELERVEARFRQMRGRETNPASRRLAAVQDELQDLEGRAEGEARAAIETARAQIASYRSTE